MDSQFIENLQTGKILAKDLVECEKEIRNYTRDMSEVSQKYLISSTTSNDIFLEFLSDVLDSYTKYIRKYETKINEYEKLIETLENFEIYIEYLKLEGINYPRELLSSAKEAVKTYKELIPNINNLINSILSEK